jgi:plastocyanin
MRFLRTAAFGAVLLILAVGALACGDDDDDGGDGGGDEPQATSTTGGAGGGDEDEVVVTAADFSFSPAALTISGASNTTITLNNTGDVPHTMNVYYNEGYTDLLRDTGNVSPGTSRELTIESDSIVQAPQLFFRCMLHPEQMEGTITVE